ncbi:hypothetical protein JCM3765_003523 [Sporobolomyces pararoseus]
MSSINDSTSAAPAPTATENPSTSGNCVVCGKETKTRCSPCLRHGNGGIWYCSEAHQKLTWRFHKRVCGPRSNPFTFPKLERMRLSKLKYLHTEPSTWIKYFQQLDRLPTVEAAEKELRASLKSSLSLIRGGGG